MVKLFLITVSKFIKSRSSTILRLYISVHRTYQPVEDTFFEGRFTTTHIIDNN